MNGIIIDTTLLAAHERGKFNLRTFFQSHVGTPYAVSAMTVSEMWHGVERASASHKAEKAATVSGLLGQTKVLDFTEEIARVHARLWAELEKTGQRIGAHDMIIAATCLHHDYALATFNVDEFKRVRGLKLVD